jgi:hypothetical protein
VLVAWQPYTGGRGADALLLLLLLPLAAAAACSAAGLGVSQVKPCKTEGSRQPGSILQQDEAMQVLGQV